MTDILVTSPFRPFTLPTQFKAVFNGYIYCGTIDAVDPSVSQVPVYIVNESGDKVPVAQPLRTNAGGFLVYNGQPAKFVTSSNHSLLVRDSLGGMLWYSPNMSSVDPDTAFNSIINILDRTSVATVSDLSSVLLEDVGNKVEWRGYYEESDGGGNWGIVRSGNHVSDGGSIFSISPTLYVEANLKGKRVNVRKFGARAVADGSLYDCIEQIRKCEAYVRKEPDPNLQQTMYFPCGKYGISDTWHIDDTLDFSIYFDNVHFTSMSTTAKGAMILCSDWVQSSMLGKVRFDNTNNPVFAKFDTGLSLQSSAKGTTKNAFYNVTSMWFRAGLIVGEASNDLICSENTFFNYNNFECTISVDGGGAQTGAAFVGCNLLGTTSPVVTGPIHAMWLKGGFWVVNGGEVLTVSSPTYQCIRMNPDKGVTPSYPQLRINGAILETSSPLALIDNPDGVVLNRSIQPGQLCVIGSGGYCGGEGSKNANFIEAADDFYGKVQVTGNNLYTNVARNAFNISVGPVAEIETDSTSWGIGFRDWVGGCNGGILRHTNMLSALAWDPEPDLYSSGVKKVVRFATKSPIARYSRYNQYYNPATGLLTCPQGGFSSLIVDCTVVAPGLAGDIFIEVDGVAIAYGQITGSVAKVSAYIDKLSHGQTVGVYLQTSSNITLTPSRLSSVNFVIAN